MLQGEGTLLTTPLRLVTSVSGAKYLTKRRADGLILASWFHLPYWEKHSRAAGGERVSGDVSRGSRPGGRGRGAEWRGQWPPRAVPSNLLFQPGLTYKGSTVSQSLNMSALIREKLLCSRPTPTETPTPSNFREQVSMQCPARNGHPHHIPSIKAKGTPRKRERKRR